MRSTVIISAVLSLSLLGCPPIGGVDKDDTAPPEGDTDTDTDTDTDADRDTDTDTDTAADTATDVALTDLTFTIEGEYAGTAMELTWFNAGDEVFEVGDTIGTASVDDATVTMSVPDPAPEDMFVLDDSVPEMTGALYMPALHVDDDADGEHDSDEIYVGAGPTWVAFLQGVTPEYEHIGFVDGWNAIIVDLGGGGGPPEVGSIDDIPVEASLWPQEDITIGGTFGGPIVPTEMGYALTSYMWFHTQTLDHTVDETVPVGDDASWSVTIEGPPAEDHFFAVEWYQEEIALELGIAYQDDDGSGAFSLADDHLGYPCYDGDYVMMLYLPGFTTLDYAISMQMQGLHAGWVPMAGIDAPEPSFLDETQVQSLELSHDCDPF